MRRLGVVHRRRRRVPGVGPVAAGPPVTVRVVVADDQELVRAGFAMILDAQPDIEVVAEAADGLEAVAAVLEHRPDVLLLDIRMPRMDGIEAVRIVCAQSAARVVMLTTFDQDDYVYEALSAGASGFLLKDVRRDDLAHAVRVAAAGEALLAPSVTRRLIDDVVRRRPLAPVAADLAVLTAREKEALVLLGRGLSNAEISAAMAVSAHTVKTYVSSVLSKLHLRDRAQAAITAYESGLIVPGSP
ncbi:Response regulator receiver protein [Saccharothrix espanaensis DSM 44229]|uniref:Response regulator receiver protein n=1 Tax=Saccharothrix espanaensis (strain ATCC 51144 / DSM 44229 / JCM 9112 / NBRC 15066 / NRRL 15764) TaxID=1179773 RepID=K0K4K8_SACES|nr:Response regulator receiver protein [Saccharothrix espanaensis DSM 44229]